MTVPVAPVTFTASIASGSTTVFPYGFMIADDEDMAVTLDGVLQTSGFTVSGAGNPAGGDVTFLVAPPVGTKVVRYLAPILKRETDYQQFGDWTAAVVNPDFDRVWLAMQALDQNTSRSLKLPIDTEANQEITEDAEARANKCIKFDADGNMTVSLFDPDEAQQAGADAIAAAAAAEAAADIAVEAANTVDLSSFAKKDGSNSPSGTWSISISGNAATSTTAAAATTATTATTANAIADGAVSTAEKIADSIITPAKMAQQPGESSGALSGLTEFAKTDIPSWATQIDIVFSGVSLAVTDRLRVQLGAASYSTSGYAAVAGANSGDASLTTGLPMMSGNIPIADTYYGTMTIKKLTAAGNTWSMVSLGHSGTVVQNGAGEIALAAPLERVRFNTVGGAAFDAGNVSIKYR